MSYEENDAFIDRIISAWTGHKAFTKWLCREREPEVVVELGVDYGFSTFCFGNELTRLGKGTIYGIDWFKGDAQTGWRDTEGFVLHHLERMNLGEHTKLVKSTFDDALASWDKPIDVLHIDGLHTYEEAKHDLDGWRERVKDDGIIIMHDVCIFRDDFGVYRVFNEIGEEYHVGYFPHSAGLGVVTKNRELYDKIVEEFTDFIPSRHIIKA